jgi:hypothetical protein
VPTIVDQNIAAVRRFNRFYTQRLGLLRAGGLYAPFSLTEARVLYELARRPECTASQLASELALDGGFSVAFSTASRATVSLRASVQPMMAVKRSCR